MNKPNFEQTVSLLNSPDKPPHFLAMDQSPGTHKKHFEKFGIRFDPRRAELIRTAIALTPDLGNYFNAAIQEDMFHDLKDKDGRPLSDRLWENGVLTIGKKCGVDKRTGLIPKDDMLSLDRELERLVNIGVHAVKIRNTIGAVIQQDHAINAASQMVYIHEKCARNGEITPVLEPEFLVDNPGSLRDNTRLMKSVLGDIIYGIKSFPNPDYPFTIKTSFPTPGSKHPTSDEFKPSDCADAFEEIVDETEMPPELKVRFLSGGHSPVKSRLYYQACARRSSLRDRVGTSFSRAILESTYKEAWRTGHFSAVRAQNEITRQGVLNELARIGEYDPDMEERQLHELRPHLAFHKHVIAKVSTEL